MRWRGEKQRWGYLMSGRRQIPEFLAHACKTAATLAGHCGFVLQLHCRVLCWLKCWQKIKTVYSQYCPEVLIWNHILQQCTGTKLAQFGDSSFCHFAQRTLLKCAPTYLAPRDVKGCGANQTETHFKTDFMQTLTLEINVSPSAKVLMKFCEGAGPPSRSFGVQTGCVFRPAHTQVWCCAFLLLLFSEEAPLVKTELVWNSPQTS